MELRPYVDADFWLTDALERDPEVMRELGGVIDRDRLANNHRRRLRDRLWLTIVPEPPGSPVGTIGVWETRHGGCTLHETGWMVLPSHQGRGIAGAALRLLIERITTETSIPSLHAFPPVSNVPSNALCRKAGFSLVEEVDFVYADRKLRCNHWSLDLPERSRAWKANPNTSAT